MYFTVIERAQVLFANANRRPKPQFEDPPENKNGKNGLLLLNALRYCAVIERAQALPPNANRRSKPKFEDPPGNVNGNHGLPQ